MFLDSLTDKNGNPKVIGIFWLFISAQLYVAGFTLVSLGVGFADSRFGIAASHVFLIIAVIGYIGRRTEHKKSKQKGNHTRK